MTSQRSGLVACAFCVFAFCVIFLLTSSRLSVYAAPSVDQPVFSIDAQNIVTLLLKKPQISKGSLTRPTFTDPNQHLLEAGFPVQLPARGGTYHSGPAINTLVEDLDGDGHKDIIRGELATGPLHAVNYLGQELPGFPVQSTASGSAYSAASNGLLVVSSRPGYAAAFSGKGRPIWVRRSANFNENPPSLFGTNEQYQMFIDENDWKLHSYDQLGQVFPGWPVSTQLNQDTHTAAIADLNQDGTPDVVTVSGATSQGMSVSAITASGSALPHWPITLPGGFADEYPAIGNVGTHGEIRVVVIGRLASSPFTPTISIITPSGQVERTIALPEASGATRAGAVSLADLNRDGKLDIIAQLTSANTEYVIVVAYDRTGTPLPGWPFETKGRQEWVSDSAPVIGDIDGDSLPEVVFTTQLAGSGTTGYIYVLNHDGTPAEAWNQTGIYPIGMGAVPAIADIDNDQHNEIIISGNYWDGFTGSYDAIWVYDLNKGNSSIVHSPNIEWGQFMHDAQHTGFSELWVN